MLTTPTRSSKTTSHFATLLSDVQPFTWLSTLRVVGTHAETLTAHDGGTFTGYMLEVTYVHPHTSAEEEEEEEEEEAAEPDLEKCVWCLARRYRQFNQLRADFMSTELRALPVPQKGWLWSSSTDDTLVAGRLRGKNKDRKSQYIRPYWKTGTNDW